MRSTCLLSPDPRPLTPLFLLLLWPLASGLWPLPTHAGNLVSLLAGEATVSLASTATPEYSELMPLPPDAIGNSRVLAELMDPFGGRDRRTALVDVRAGIWNDDDDALWDYGGLSTTTRLFDVSFASGESLMGTVADAHGFWDIEVHQRVMLEWQPPAIDNWLTLDGEQVVAGYAPFSNHLRAVLAFEPGVYRLGFDTRIAPATGHLLFYVPEPTTWGMLVGLGMVLLVLNHRGRRGGAVDGDRV